MKAAYCSLTYLFTLDVDDLDLPADATEAEIEDAAEAKMEKVIEYISEQTGFLHNDCEISVI